MKNLIIFLLLIFSLSLSASEYYPRLVGYNTKGERIMKGTCISYPLNDFLYKLKSKENKILKYYSEEKLDYIKFLVLDQKGNDDFYFENIELNNDEKKYLRDPKILNKYLSNLYYVLYKDRKELLEDKVFENVEEIEDFILPLFALIGILETFSANDCTQVTWIAKLY